MMAGNPEHTAELLAPQMGSYSQKSPHSIRPQHAVSQDSWHVQDRQRAVSGENHSSTTALSWLVQRWPSGPRRQSRQSPSLRPRLQASRVFNVQAAHTDPPWIWAVHLLNTNHSFLVHPRRPTSPQDNLF